MRMYHHFVRGCYRPKTIVEYERTAYSYPASDVRITFDRNVRGTMTGNGLFDEKLKLALPLNGLSHGVLEIKYTHFLPYPIKQLTQQLNHYAQSNSKYVQARTLLKGDLH